MKKRIKDFTRRFKRELEVYRLVAKDPETPWLARALLLAAVGYVVMPFDLIPDFIPVLGQLDDLVIVPSLVWLALRLAPPAVLTRCRELAAEQSKDVPPLL